MDDLRSPSPPRIYSKCIGANSAGSSARDAAIELQKGFRPACSEWSPDGTCIIACTVSNSLHTYTVYCPPSPHEDPADEPQAWQYRPDELLFNAVTELNPVSAWTPAESLLSSAVYPFFSSQDSYTMLVLAAARNQPIQLRSALDLSAPPVSTYPCINERNEEFLPQHSLLFLSDGKHFVSGSKSMLSIYDVERSGEPPVEIRRTAISRKQEEAFTPWGVKGLFSSLSVSCEKLLAAGTINNKGGVVLYANEGRGDKVAVFEIERPSDEEEMAGLDIGSKSISQVQWSPCGRYLYVVPRLSNSVPIYDIRVTGRKVGWLHGLNSKSNLRMDLEVVETPLGHEVWRGDLDGRLRIWQNPVLMEGPLEPWSQWKAHEDPVVAAKVHHTGSVVATFSSPSSSYKPLAYNDSSDVKGKTLSREDSIDDAESTSSYTLPGHAENLPGASLKLWSV